MQYLWIGCLESDEEFKRKAKKGYELASAQVSQKNLVKGIEEAEGCVFDSINGAVLPPYPAYQEKNVGTVVWEHKKNAWDISVGYKNIKYYNRISCKKAMKAAAKDWIARRYRGEELRIFVYSMRSAPMAAAVYIKKRIRKAKLYLIITDLPQFMDLGQSRVKAALKKIDWLQIKAMQRRMDGFILYAKKMAEFLHIPDNRWLLMEGSFEQGEEVSPTPSEKKKAVMYSGRLDRQYGIPMLLDAFMAVDFPDAELWLTGGGNAEEVIRECAGKDKRIRYFGFLPGRKDVLALQRQASLLVNMRLPSEEASAYCFPSKLFEYMATGIPVLTFRLEGIPEEYFPYLTVAEEESREALSKAIRRCLSGEEDMARMGRAAAEFIRTRKNNIEQSRRILAFVRKMENEG